MTIQEIAERVGGTVVGAANSEIHAVASLLEAHPGDLSFLANPKYTHQVAETKASCVLLANGWEGVCSAPSQIRVENPDKAFAQVAPLFAPPPIVRTPGIHPTAVIGEHVSLGADVYIGPYAVIEDDCVIGDQSVIEAQTCLCRGVKLGKGVHLYPQVVVREYCEIGDRSILHAGVKIGTDGFGYTVEFANGVPMVNKIPQLGIVQIGCDVEIGSNTCIDRARFGRTKIGNCVKIDNLVQIGHNVQVGDLSGIISQSGIAGSTRIGSGVMIWSQAGVSGHLHIADRAQVGPQCGVTKDVPAGEYVIGSPNMTKREFAENVLMPPKQIAKLKKQVAQLAERIRELEERK